MSTKEAPITFDQLDLNPCLQEALKVCGYTTPTPVQASAIPIVLGGKDLIAVAPTGTGKTAAFVLPALQVLSSKGEQKGRKTTVLILTPTRELAHQITSSAIQYGKFIKPRFTICNVIGGMPYRRQLQALAARPDMIVATPGRLIDFIESGDVDLSEVEYLVLDEADRMLDMGFRDAVKMIIDETPNNRKTLLFSATLDDRITKLARDILNNPEQIRLTPKISQNVSIEQRVYMVNDNNHKSRLLSELISTENIFKAIIFSGTKINADKLARHLNDQGFEASAIHGDLKQNQRNAVLDKLRKDKIQFLVATDVAARGIDIAGITHVINYDFPRFCEDYVHRIGRTGRAGKTGVAISLIVRDDMRHVKQVERYTKQTLQITKQNSNGQSEPFVVQNERKNDQSAPRRREDNRQERSFGRRNERSDRFSKSRDDKAPRFARQGEGRSDRSDRFAKQGEARSDRSDRFARQGESRSDRFAPQRENRSSDRFGKQGEARSDRFAQPRADRSDRFGKSRDNNNRPGRFSNGNGNKPRAAGAESYGKRNGRPGGRSRSNDTARAY